MHDEWLFAWVKLIKIVIKLSGCSHVRWLKGNQYFKKHLCPVFSELNSRQDGDGSQMLIHLPFNQLVHLVGLEKFIAFICPQSWSCYTNNCVSRNKILVNPNVSYVQWFFIFNLNIIGLLVYDKIVWCMKLLCLLCVCNFYCIVNYVWPVDRLVFPYKWHCPH